LLLIEEIDPDNIVGFGGVGVGLVRQFDKRLILCGIDSCGLFELAQSVGQLILLFELDAGVVMLDSGIKSGLQLRILCLLFFRGLVSGFGFPLVLGWRRCGGMRRTTLRSWRLALSTKRCLNLLERELTAVPWFRYHIDGGGLTQLDTAVGGLHSRS